jgi:hypothetical protein
MMLTENKIIVDVNVPHSDNRSHCSMMSIFLEKVNYDVPRCS